MLDNCSTGRDENLAAIRNHPKLEFRLHQSLIRWLCLKPCMELMPSITWPAAVGVKLVADDPVRTIETNIYPTDHLLRLAAQGMFASSSSPPRVKSMASIRVNHGSRTTICISAQPADHGGPMAAQRRLMSFLLWPTIASMESGVTVGRFFNVVGPRQVGNYGMVVPRFVDAALNGGPVVVYDDGSQVRCFAHVQEIAQCVVRLMETDSAEGRVFNIGSDQPISILQLAQRVIEKVNRQ